MTEPRKEAKSEGQKAQCSRQTASDLIDERKLIMRLETRTRLCVIPVQYHSRACICTAYLVPAFKTNL